LRKRQTEARAAIAAGRGEAEGARHAIRMRRRRALLAGTDLEGLAQQIVENVSKNTGGVLRQ
ncbi:MAG: hypothetical protein AAGC96_13010, partial [Pseudomonadota bacterium]